MINPGYDTRAVVGDQGSGTLLDMDPMGSVIGAQRIQHIFVGGFLVPLS